MAAIIHFGTDGWRARRDGDFNEENVARIADAAGALWERMAPGAIVYVGYDTRPEAEHFACLAGRMLASHGLTVKVCDRPSPTPALSWTVAHDARACGGLTVTGSHNPPDYLGIKLRMDDGGTASDDFVDLLEEVMEPSAPAVQGAVQRVDFVTPYLDELCSLVDASAIARAGLRVVYDPLYGAARGCFPLVLGALGIESIEIHNADDEGALDLHPDPIEPWVDECERAVTEHSVSAGLINDGDADRVGAVDEHGVFVSPHKIIALVAGHLVVNRGMSGRVVLNLSTSTITKRVCKALGCRVTVRPVGFKHIYKEMCKGDVLIGGEEAGGIGIPSHLCERDGLLVNLLLCELMAHTGKTLGQLVAEMESAMGTMVYGRRDLRLENEVIEMFRTMLPGLNPHEVAGQTPVAVSHMDGLRLEFADESWLLLRPGGTEPVVRVYAEAPTVEGRDRLLEAGCALARGGFA
ncbi:phosphoglucomutase [Collinsella sp. An2]|uniref:phosphoglucomutase n=1 Tax=Collinsella sp. An2 TaxID=1965585 RepID=UPI000B3AE44C|nr:phosphoglucomutase [Collinsella sp. An2]OUP06728.1 phosphoglucomutase [Collinsella sp. An2]